MSGTDAALTDPAAPTPRIHSLDGLRGVAALIVVVYHALLVTPTLWDQIAGKPVSNTVQWILAYTPLRIVWAGDDAVWIFFILSGFVLVRPYLGGRRLVAGRFWLRRLVRLWIPFLGSFVLAVTLRAVRPEPDEVFTGWIFIHRLPTATHEWVTTLFLFQGDSTSWNNVWWSLRWEVWFSALVPVVVAAAGRLRHRAGTVAVICLVIVGLSHTFVTVLGVVEPGHDNPALYLPMFGIGTALAMGEDRVRARLGHLSRRVAWLCVVVSSSALTSTVAVLVAVQRTGASPTVAWSVAGPIGVAGAGALVALALCAPGPIDLLTRHPIQWLGERSYTLYLVHEPILVTMVVTLGVTTLTWWWIPFAISLSLGATAILYPVIERPALRLLRHIPWSTDPRPEHTWIPGSTPRPDLGWYGPRR